MLGFLLAPENVAFSTALAIMLLIGVVEAFGLGAGAIEVDVDGLDHHFLGWLGVGRLPLLMLMVVALACFGLVGLMLQQAALEMAGHVLPAWVAAPSAALLSVPATAIVGRGVARVMPRDETTAVSLDTLIGRRAHIVVGTATEGSPARARAYDVHGQTHYILVEPSSAGEQFAEGDEILLVRRDAHNFKAVAVAPRAIMDLGGLQ